jgi:hypothetical protein
MKEQLISIIEELDEDEALILLEIAKRLQEGQQVYGSWSVHDERDYPREALEEVVDALNYCAAELVRLSEVRS